MKGGNTMWCTRRTLRNSALALGVLTASAATLAQAQVIVFQKLKHTPIGGALLRVDTSRNALEVLPSDPLGGDGVAIELPETTSWSARTSVSGSRLIPPRMGWEAIADGHTISAASIQQNGSRFEIKASFTGGTTSTHSVQVYADGQLVGSVGGVPPVTPVVAPIDWCRIAPEFFVCGFVSSFHNSTNGECEWRFVLTSRIPVTLPNGVVVTGNEVRLVEEVRPAGHYPYLTFDRIAARSNTNLLTIFAETVQ